MRTVFKFIFIILLCISATNICYGAEKEYDVTFINQNKDVIIAYIYQTNHNFKDILLPLNIATAWLDPYKQWTFQIEEGCEFFIVWRDPEFSIEAKSTDVIILNRDMVFKYKPEIIERLGK